MTKQRPNETHNEYMERLVEEQAQQAIDAEKTSPKKMNTINITTGLRKHQYGGWVKFQVKGTGIIGSAKIFEIGDGEDSINDYMGYGVRPTSRVSKLWMALVPQRHQRMMLYSWCRGSEEEENEIFDLDLLNDILDDLDAL